MLTSASPSRKVFDTIQILRGLAALIVVIFHLTLGNERRGQPLILDGFFRNGFAGVDLFFVISGFVIMHTSHSYFSNPSYFGTYFRKRLVRVYPIYWVTLVIIIGGIWLAEFLTKKPIIFLPTTWPSFLSAFLLLPDHPMINGVTWSLTFELYYYLIFGLLIISRQLWPIVVAILCMSALSIIDSTLFPNQQTFFYYLFSPYNLEFGSGVLVWWVIHRYKINSFVYVIILAIAGGWLLVHNTILFEEVAKRVIFYGVSSFLCLLAFTGLELNGWLKSSFVSRQLMKIGDASYLIYIIHFPFLPFYGKLISPLLTNTLTQNLGAILFVVAITFLAIDFHNRFEAPLVKKLNLLLKVARPKPNHG